MHGSPEISQAPRLTWIVAHLAIVSLAGWLLLGDDVEHLTDAFNLHLSRGAFSRCVLLAVFCITLWLRMTFTALVLLERRFGWNECIAVIGAVAFYQLGFSVLGVGSSEKLDLIDGASVGLFFLGSALNTGAELQRKRFKRDPHNAGLLYTKGLFSLVRHPNYLGDILWATAWALATKNTWALVIPGVAAGGFVFKFIPELSGYLSHRYGEQYAEWTTKTKRLVPWVY